jgi:SAM-dependent methyltransferase
MATWRRRVLDGVNALTNVAGIQVLPLHEYRSIRSAYKGELPPEVPIPEDARAALTMDNPRLGQLRAAYAGHPAAPHTQWSEENLAAGFDLARFRGDNHYVYQTRWSPSVETYLVTAHYVAGQDRLGLLADLKEDGLFGAYTVEFEQGQRISRDLLDSVNEINFLARSLPFARSDGLRVLDLGAGYGRLAHRMTMGLPAAQVTCIDAVPLSTFLSEFYLSFRGCAERGKVVALHELAGLEGQEFDVVTNIHSLPEAPMAAIEWWLGWLGRLRVRHLLIVPNDRVRFLSTEADGSHRDWSGVLDRHGWRLVHKEPIYAMSQVAQRHALYPNFQFHLFARD